MTQIGDFELISKLGEGGMGAVFKARQVSLDRIVALKVLPQKLAKNPVFIERFQREARATAKLNHNHIIAAIGVGEANGYNYFAMEYIEGETLKARVKREGHLPEPEVLRLGIAIASALAHAHAMGLIHRDVKPENILLATDGTPKLADLGLVKAEDAEDNSLTQTGTAMGTPHYIAPEQASGKPLDGRADAYSLGCTLFHLATGRPPFDGPTPAVLMVKHINERLPHPQTLRPELSAAFCAILSHLVARAPQDRYDSLDLAVADMSALIAGTPIATPGLSEAKINFVAEDSPYELAAAPVAGEKAATRSHAPISGDSRSQRHLAAAPARNLNSLYAAGAGLVVLAGIGWFFFGRSTATAPDVQVAAASPVAPPATPAPVAAPVVAPPAVPLAATPPAPQVVAPPAAAAPPPAPVAAVQAVPVTVTVEAPRLASPRAEEVSKRPEPPRPPTPNDAFQKSKPQNPAPPPVPAPAPRVLTLTLPPEPGADAQSLVGKDMHGWNVEKPTWAMEDGALVGHGVTGNAQLNRFSVLPRDFDLVMELNSDRGFHFGWSSLLNGVRSSNYVQAENDGSLKLTHFTPGKDLVELDRASRAMPFGARKYRVIVRGNRAVVAVDGVVIMDSDKVERTELGARDIYINAHDDGQLKIRKVLVRDAAKMQLADARPAPGAPAPVDNAAARPAPEPEPELIPEDPQVQARWVYMQYEEQFFADVRKLNPKTSAEMLATGEKMEALKPFAAELKDDHQLLAWQNELLAAEIEGAKKLMDADDFELRLLRGEPLHVGKRGKFQVLKADKGVIEIGSGGMSFQKPVAQLAAETRIKLAEMGLAGGAQTTAAVLARRGFLALLQADASEPKSLATTSIAIDTLRNADGATVAANCLERWLKNIQSIAEDAAATAAWEKLHSSHPDLAHWEALQQSLHEFTSNYHTSLFYKHKLPEITALTQKLARAAESGR